MAFTLSGQVVTQTASTTDTDLSALATLINGVATVARSTAYTVGQVVRPPTANGFMYQGTTAGTTAAAAPAFGTTEGGTTTDGTAVFTAREAMTVVTTGAGSDLLRLVSMGSFGLNVAGTLTINDTVPELLIFGANAYVISGNSDASNIVIATGGTFTLGGRTTLNSATRSVHQIGGVYISRQHANHWNGSAISIKGTFNWYGTVQGNTAPVAMNAAGATLTIRDGVWVCRQKCTSAPGVQSMMFLNQGTVDIIGFRTEGECSISRVGSPTITNLSGVAPVQSRGITQNETSTTPLNVTGYNPSGCLSDFGFYQGVVQTRGIRSYDSPVGTNLLVSPTDPGQQGWVEMWRNVTVRALDASNAAISGALAYIRDTNNGNRGSISGVSGTGPYTVTSRNTATLATDGIAMGTDRVYINATTGTGLTASFAVLLGIYSATVGVGLVNLAYDSGSTRIDRRGKTDTAGSRANTDPFDIHLWAYGYLYSRVADFSMLGTGTAVPTSNMIADTNVTLSQSAAAALTSIDTLDNLYDAAKNWKCQSTQANLEYPSIGAMPVAANGSVLDLGSRNLVIDAAAAAAFAINTGTNTITVKATTLAAGAKFASLTTTGTVTTAGGAAISAPYTDADGTRVSIKTSDGLALSTYLTIDGTPQPWQVGQTSRTISVGPTSAVRIYAHAYGYQPKVVNVTGNNAADYVLSLVPETNVDTTLDTTTRDTITATMASGTDASSRIFLSVNADLRQYTPGEVLNALHWFVVSQGSMIAAASLAANSVNAFAVTRGGVIIRSQGFYGKIADSVTTVSNLGILAPLAITVDPSVYVAMPTYTPVEKNTSGHVLQFAPWTQQQADVPTWVAQQASVLDIPSATLAAATAAPIAANVERMNGAEVIGDGTAGNAWRGVGVPA